MAPEFIKPELVGLRSMKPNPATDVWSFGMLCLEILTGQAPFHNLVDPEAVLIQLIGGILPARPSAEVTDRGLSEELWVLMQQCWDRKPEQRPTMNMVIRRMETLPPKQSGSQRKYPYLPRRIVT